MTNTSILIVDDKDENRYLLEALLKGHGFKVSASANGAAALELLHDGAFDLIISDILMPVMDGFELCRRVRADASLRQIPFVIYTATYTGAKDEEFALKLGANRFVVKPCEPEVILTVVREVLAAAAPVAELPAPTPLQEEEVLKLYNERLVRKLEQKMLQLEAEASARAAEEEKLRVALNRLKCFIDANIVGVVIATTTGRIIEANDYYLNLIGFTREELVGGLVNWRAITPPEWLTADNNAIHEMLELGKCTPFEKEYLLRDGTRVPIFMAGTLLPGPQEEIAAFVIDLRERKQAEERMQQLQAELLQAQKMEVVGRLAGGIAHDFNNKLQVILGCSDLALDTLPADDPLRALLQDIRDAAEGSAELTHQLLAFARQQPVAPQILNLNDTISGMMKMLKRLIGEGIDLVFQPGSSLGNILIDPVQVDQLLANLAVNARDAIGSVGTITIATKNIAIDHRGYHGLIGCAPGPYIELTITDTGCGMAEPTLEQIFEPFFTTKPLDHGTGLGLSTVYGIIKQNEGQIAVESALGQGTTFFICLPQAPPEISGAGGGTATADLPLGSETVLLVEDDKGVMQLARQFLLLQGYQVLSATTSAECLRLLQNRPGTIDVLLTDLIMPRMTGLELAARARELEPELKVVYMSGCATEIIDQEQLAAAKANLLNKPFSRAELSQIIRDVLDT